MPDEHRQIWQYLIDNKMNYPDSTFVPPFKRPEKDDKPRKISVAQFDAVESNILGFPRVIRLRICDGGGQYAVPLLGDRNPARAIERVLFTFSRRGWLTIFPTGNSTDFRVMAQQYIVPLLHKGYRIQPINAGSELIALRVQKGKHTWYLIDYEKAVGIEYEKPTECRLVGKHAQHARCKCLEMAHAALSTIQNHLISVFRVSLQLSIGSVAIKAAKHAMQKELMKWRPHPLLVTMCRLGGHLGVGLSSEGDSVDLPGWWILTVCTHGRLHANFPTVLLSHHPLLMGYFATGSTFAPSSAPVLSPSTCPCGEIELAGFLYHTGKEIEFARCLRPVKLTELEPLDIKSKPDMDFNSFKRSTWQRMLKNFWVQ